MENNPIGNVAGAQKILGKRVRDLRKVCGWTQAELAERLNEYGLSFQQGTVAKLEGGSRPTTVTELAALSNLLNQGPESLLADHEMPEGMPEYAEADRRHEAAKKDLENAVAEFLRAREDLAYRADQIRDAEVVGTVYIARSLAESPERIVAVARRRYEAINDRINREFAERTIEGEEISPAVNAVLKDFAQKDLAEQSMTQLLEVLNGLDPETS